MKDTKTHAARRIALDADTIDMWLRRLERAQSFAGLAGCQLPDEGFGLTTQPDGSTPLHPDTVTKNFRRLSRRAGLSGVRLHDLRHMHATELLAAGVPVRTVSGRLGHANAATTLNVYAHFLETSDRQAADVISSLLNTGAAAKI